MKHLLIILLSILLLTSPVIGKNHKEGTLYKYGLGYLIYPDGGKYVGSWEDGKMWNGTFTWSNGEKYVGSWKNGKYWNGIRYYKGGKIKYKYVNGKWINQ